MDEYTEILTHGFPAPDFQNFYREVIKQIDKDFHPYAELAIPEGVITLDWIYTSLNNMVNTIVADQNSVLGAIIYRVDLPEKQVRKAMINKGIQEKPEELTRMILRREAQKVWIRHHFNG
jgi:hypothetical protein